MRHTARQEYQALLRLGLPVLVTQLGVITVSFVDTMMLGAYSTEALAASAFVNSIFVVPVVMLMGFAGGITPLVGALFSQSKLTEAGRTLRAGLQVNILIAAVFTALLAILYLFIGKMGQPEELLPICRPYYLILLASLIPVSAFSTGQQTANGLTDTVSPMAVIIGCNVINILFNYLLIFGHGGFPELGALGAGIATLISRVAGMLAMYAVIFLRCSYRRTRNGLFIPGRLAQKRRRIWVTSYPVMIQSGIECFLWSFGTIVSGWFGKVQLAAYQIVNTMAQLGFMTFMSFATATSIRVANKHGLGDLEGMRLTTRSGVHLNLVLATAASLIFWLLGPQLLHLFTPDMEVIAEGLLLIPPLILYQYGDALQYTYANAQRGTAVVKPLAWISLLSYLVVGAPVLYLLGVVFDFETVGVFYSFSIALFLAAALLFITFRSTMSKLASAHA